MSSSKRFEGVRSMVMSGRKQEIPHIIPLMYEGDKSEFLVTVVGRQPTYRNLASQNLVNVCNNYKLIDIYRKLYPNDKSYTWMEKFIT